MTQEQLKEQNEKLTKAISDIISTLDEVIKIKSLSIIDKIIYDIAKKTIK